MMHLSMHNIRSIKATHKEFSPGGTQWVSFLFEDQDGKQIEVTAFVDKPIPIEGAELIALLAAQEEAKADGSLAALLQASIDAVKARKEKLNG